jgi:uncharacterized lipoprotein YmbA
MMKRLASLSACVLLFLILLPGCLGLKQSYPEKRQFVLDVARSGDASGSKIGEVLRISRIHVSPRFEGKGFVYRTGDLTYESDFYNEFFTSPGPLLIEEMRKWVRGSGLFDHVPDPGSRLAPTHVLESTVSALYGDYRESEAPKAVMEMHFSLMRNTSPGSEVAFENGYRKEVSVTGDSPDALAEGWNEGLSQILKDLETDLADRVPKASE